MCVCVCVCVCAWMCCVRVCVDVCVCVCEREREREREVKKVAATLNPNFRTQFPRELQGDGTLAAATLKQDTRPILPKSIGFVAYFGCGCAN